MADVEATPSGQPYELFTFARKHGIPIESARAIIRELAADRLGPDAAAKTLSESLLYRPTEEE